MAQTHLLGIFCNWSPFACLNAAGMAHLKMPSNYGFIRVMCIGRINQALILRAFEYGADGVILLECKGRRLPLRPGPEVAIRMWTGFASFFIFSGIVSHGWSSGASWHTKRANWSRPCGTFPSRCKRWVRTPPSPV